MSERWGSKEGTILYLGANLNPTCLEEELVSFASQRRQELPRIPVAPCWTLGGNWWTSVFTRSHTSFPTSIHNITSKPSKWIKMSTMTSFPWGSRSVGSPWCAVGTRWCPGCSCRVPWPSSGSRWTACTASSQCSWCPGSICHSAHSWAPGPSIAKEEQCSGSRWTAPSSGPRGTACPASWPCSWCSWCHWAPTGAPWPRIA